MPAAMMAAVATARPDRIVHLAGQSSVHHSWIDPGGTLRTNVQGIVHLLDALRGGAPASARARGRAARTSTASWRTRDPPLREDTPLRPVSPYAVSKVAQGLLALAVRAVPGGPEVVRTRTFPHTGPGPRRGLRRELVRAPDRGDRGGPPPSRASPSGTSTPCATSPTCATWCGPTGRCCWRRGRDRAPEVYNVCTGRGVRLGDLLSRLVALAGVEVEIRMDPGRLRPSDIPVLVGDPARLRAATGWEPRIPLDRTLARPARGLARARVARGAPVAMKVLLTGGTGFLGKNVARALAARGHELRLLAREGSNLAGLPAGEIVRGDVTDAASVRRAAEGCEAVLHMAALVKMWVPDRERLRRASTWAGCANALAARGSGGGAPRLHVVLHRRRPHGRAARRRVAGPSRPLVPQRLRAHEGRTRT